MGRSKGTLATITTAPIVPTLLTGTIRLTLGLASPFQTVRGQLAAETTLPTTPVGTTLQPLTQRNAQAVPLQTLLLKPSAQTTLPTTTIVATLPPVTLRHTLD